MIESLALKTSTKAKDRAQELTAKGRSWRNSGGTLTSTKVGRLRFEDCDSGQLKGRSGSDSAEFVRALVAGDLDYVIWSYRTPIAWHYRAEADAPASQFPGWRVPDVRYSATTAQHQSIARMIAASVPTIGTGDSK